MSYISEVLRGNTETIILKILSEKDSYGYEITKEIFVTSGGLVDIKDATIYTAFRRMEKDGLIGAYWCDSEAGGRRRYYKITDAGKKYYRDKVDEYNRTCVVLSKLIGG